MNCKVVQQSLSAYIDRELTGAEMLCLRAHLSDCHCCAREETELRALKNLLSSLPNVEPAEGLEGRLLANIAAEKKSTTRFSKVAVVASLSIAAALVGFMVVPNQGQPTSVIRPAAPMKRDIAFEIGRDQVFAAGSDPLSGGHVMLAADSYGRH